MSRAPWVAHFGLARTPFSKSIAAGDLYTRPAHAEAVARIGHCVSESALGVIVGDVGVGKTVAVRAAVAALDPPATPSSTSPTRLSAPAASTSPSCGPWAPSPVSARPK